MGTGEAEMERLDYEVIWGYLWNGFKVNDTELHIYKKMAQVQGEEGRDRVMRMLCILGTSMPLKSQCRNVRYQHEGLS